MKPQPQKHPTKIKKEKLYEQQNYNSDTNSTQTAKKNIRNAHTTEPLAICNIIEKIVLMPFSDFMFCHPKEYVSVMEEFTSHKQKWNFPEISTGMAFQFVAKQTGMSPSARITTEDEAIIRKQLLNAVYQPFLDIFDMAVYDPGDPFHGSIHTPEDLLQKSAWRYVNHCRSTHIVYGNKEGILFMNGYNV